MANCVSELAILKYFSIQGHTRNPIKVMLMFWKVSTVSFMKCNVDCATWRRTLSLTTCSGVFRNSVEEYLRAFSSFSRIKLALKEKLMGVILAIKITIDSGSTNLFIRMWFIFSWSYFQEYFLYIVVEGDEIIVCPHIKLLIILLVMFVETVTNMLINWSIFGWALG